MSQVQTLKSSQGQGQSGVKRFVKWSFIFVFIIVLSGCADHMTFVEAASRQPVGFWYGLWHGIIFPVAWIISLFSDSTAIYAIYNNGGWYDFGFFLGVGGLSASLLSSD